MAHQKPTPAIIYGALSTDLQFILLNKMAPLSTYMDLCGAPHKFMIQPDGYC